MIIYYVLNWIWPKVNIFPYNLILREKANSIDLDMSKSASFLYFFVYLPVISSIAFIEICVISIVAKNIRVSNHIFCTSGPLIIVYCQSSSLFCLM